MPEKTPRTIDIFNPPYSNYALIIGRHLHPKMYGSTDSSLSEEGLWYSRIPGLRLKSFADDGGYPNLIVQPTTRRRPPYQLTEDLQTRVTKGFEKLKERTIETAPTDMDIPIELIQGMYERREVGILIARYGSNRPRCIETDREIKRRSWEYMEQLRPSPSLRRQVVFTRYAMDERMSPVNTLGVMEDIGITDKTEQLIAWLHTHKIPEWQEHIERLHVRTPLDVEAQMETFKIEKDEKYRPLYDMGLIIVIQATTHELQILSTLEEPFPVGFGSALFIPLDNPKFPKYYVFTPHFNDSIPQEPIK